MLRVNYQISYGEVKVKNNDETKVLTVKIHPANALCAFIYHYQREDGQKMAQLWSFLADVDHANRVIKNSADHKLFGSDVVSVKLNVYYKEDRQLIMPMTKSGYKVTVYYKESKKK